ncbi:MAG: cation:proton antiporter [Halomonas sp.]|uniref:cation:proton antiporter n=1 Tax=Halomonas sp. TaxID=1486246 RepID=UPI003F90E7AA
MEILFNLLILGSLLLSIIAFVQWLSARTAFPEATLLALVGMTLGFSYATLSTLWPEIHQFEPLLTASLPAEIYLWIFLPPLLFQAALSVDVREMMPDAAPILLLAVVAVFIATGMVGVSVWLLGGVALSTGLLLGAVIATTDPSAVIAIFRSVGAPARLIRLVEGESLLNDAAAIAIVGVLVASLTGNAAAATWQAGAWALAADFGGGLLFGAAAGRIGAAVLAFFGNDGKAQTALTLSLPYPVYLIGESIGVSGVVAVVATGLVLSGLGRTRTSPANWAYLQLLWAQIASLAGATVFLLAALQVPKMLEGITLAWLPMLAVVIVATLLARLVALFGFLPLLSRLKLSAPISASYKLAITWGGLRGAVTLVLALGIAEQTALPEQIRHFVAILATGFVLFSLLVNGASLRGVIRCLKLNKLSHHDSALQQQAIRLSTTDVENAVKRTAHNLHIAPSITEEVIARYHRDMAIETAPLDLDQALPERDRMTIALVTLAIRERDLIPRYGSGVTSIHNLDAMMHNSGRTIDAARSDGRIGYNREARKILATSLWLKPSIWLNRHLRIRWPLSWLLTNRFELLICRRAALEELRHYNAQRLTPLFGERMCALLDEILDVRITAVDQAIQQTEAQFGPHAYRLEQRMLRLFALRRSTESMEEMVQDRLISQQVFDDVQRGLHRAWRNALDRPHLSHTAEMPEKHSSSEPNRSE